MANYTYTVTSISGQVGTSAGLQTATLVLTPNDGHRLTASNFSINDVNNVYENIVVSQVEDNVVITFDLIDSINYGPEDLVANLEIIGEASSDVVKVDGDISFEDSENDDFVIEVKDSNDNPLPDGTLDIVVEGEEGDEIIVGEIVIRADGDNSLPDGNGDGEPDELTIDLPDPLTLGDNSRPDGEGGLVYDIIVVIPADDITLSDESVSTGDITNADGTPTDTTPVEGGAEANTLTIDSVRVNTDNLNGLDGGFITIIATGDPGAAATINITPTVVPSTSTATYPAIEVDVLVDSNGSFVRTIRIPSSATDAGAGNVICDKNPNEDVTDITWGFDIVADDDSEVEEGVVIDDLNQNTTKKVVIRIVTNDINVPQPNQGGAVITTTDWTHDTIAGETEIGNTFDGGFIKLIIPPGSDSWTLIGTPAEIAANSVDLKINGDISLTTPDFDPGCDFCNGKVSVDADGNLELFLEYSGGTMQPSDAIYEIQLTNVVAFIRPAVVLNFLDGQNYTVDKKTITYVGSAAGALVTGTELSVTLTANSGFTWHSTDFAATETSFVASGHSQDNIASLLITPTTTSLATLNFNGTAQSTITISWTLQGVHGSTPALFNFTPSGEPRAISTISFNSGDDNRGSNGAQETISINELSDITNVETRAWSKNYTLTSDGDLVFDNPHLVGLTAASSNAVTVTGPTLVGAGPVYTQVNGTLSGVHPSNSNLVNINITGNAYVDTDADGDPDVTDTDDDGDGVEDVSDAFPLDSTRSEVIFNTTQGDISSILGGAIDVSFVLNHTIDAILVPSGDSDITFSYEGTELTTTTALPFSDGTTTLRVQVPQSNNYDGSTTGVLTITADGQSDIVINVSQTEEATTFSTTSASPINHPNTGATAQTISVNTNNAGLAWTAVSSDTDVIAITAGASGTGSGSVTYTAVPNGFDADATSATVTLSAPGQTDIVITINVAAGVVTTFTTTANSVINHTNTGATGETITVNTNNNTLAWTAVTSNSDVVNITAGTSGTGNGSVTYTAVANGFDDPATSATITLSAEGFADIVITINIAVGVVTTWSLTSQNASLPASGTDPQYLTLTTNNPLITWTAVSSNTDAVQITTVGPNMGSSGRIDYTYTPNDPGDPQVNTSIVLSSEGLPDLTYSIIIYAGEDVTFSTTSDSTIEWTGDGAVGQTVPVNTNSDSLEWTAVSSDTNVVNITSGSSGTGSGAVTYTAVPTEAGGDDATATITLSAEGFDDIVITINIGATEISFLIEGENSNYTDDTPVASSETDSSISIGSNKSTLTWAVTGVSDADDILTITTFSGDLQTDLDYTTSVNAANESSKSATIIISYFDNGLLVGNRDLVVNLPEGINAPVEFSFDVYETGTTNAITSLSFNDFASPIDVDVYIDSEGGTGGFTAALGSTDFTISPESGNEGTTTITITPVNNASTVDIVDTLTVTSVSHPTSSIALGLTQVGYTTISVEAVDFDIAAAPTSTPLAFRFTSNNSAAGWRQAGDGTGVAGTGIPDEFAVPETIPEGAFTLRGGSIKNNPEFTFELPTPTDSGTQTLTAEWSAIRLQAPPEGVPNVAPNRQYDDYIDANGTVEDSITITTAPLAWSVSESSINLTSIGTSVYGIDITINDRRLAWTAVSSDNSSVILAENAGGTGSGELTFSVPTSAPGASAYSETITLSAPNVSDIVVTINVAAAPAFEFVITPNYYNKTVANINSTGNTLLLDVNDTATTWTAVSSSENLVITNGSSGVGDGTVTYSIVEDSTITDTGEALITLSASGIDDVVVTLEISNPKAADLTVNRSGVVAYGGEAIDETFEVSHTRDIGVEIPGGDVSVYIDNVLATSNTTVVNSSGLTQDTKIRVVVAAQSSADLANSILFTSTGLTSKTVNVKQFIETPDFTASAAINTRVLTEQVLWEACHDDWITNPPIDKTIASYATLAAAVANGVPKQLVQELYWYGVHGFYDIRPHPDNPSEHKGRYPGQDAYGRWRILNQMRTWWDETQHVVPYVDLEHEFPDSFTVDSSAQNLQIWNGPEASSKISFVYFRGDQWENYMPTSEDLWVHLGTRDNLWPSNENPVPRPYNAHEYYKASNPNQFAKLIQMNHYHEESHNSGSYQYDILNDGDDLFDHEIALFIEENTTNAVRTFEVPVQMGSITKTLTIIQKASEN